MALPFLYVRGVFSGYYLTDQKTTLTEGQTMPEPDKHKVRVYRGELTEFEPINDFNPQEHLNRDALFLYNVTNIQLLPGNKQHIQEKVIYDFEQVVIKDAKVKDSWEIDGKTYGILEGTFLGKIKQPSHAPKPPDPSPPGPEPLPPTPPDSSCLSRLSGCGIRLWDILKWLLLLLLLLLLLKKCNQSGCNFKLNNCKECEAELKKLREQIDSLKSDNTLDCSNTAESGGKGVTEKKHILGNTSGTVIINYDMKSVPDKLEVFYEGKLVASTRQIKGNVKGFVGASNDAKCCGSLSFDFKFNKEDFCKVRVTGGSSTTDWSYTLNCPQ